MCHAALVRIAARTVPDREPRPRDRPILLRCPERRRGSGRRRPEQRDRRRRQEFQLRSRVRALSGTVVERRPIYRPREAMPIGTSLSARASTEVGIHDFFRCERHSRGWPTVARHDVRVRPMSHSLHGLVSVAPECAVPGTPPFACSANRSCRNATNPRTLGDAARWAGQIASIRSVSGV